MKNTTNKIENIMFAMAMIVISGACLVYNIRTARDAEVTASWSDIVYVAQDNVGAISDIAAANIEYSNAATVHAISENITSRRELLPPVVVPVD